VWGATSFGEWRCEAEDRDCRHPNAKKEKFRYPRSEAPAAASPIAAPPAIAAPGAPSPATAH
jgi:hypothetical protein